MTIPPMEITGAILTSAVAMAVPLLLAALGELVSERAGVINVGLEGIMLTGAFATMVTVYFSGSPLLGVVSGGASGLALAGIFALAVVARNANQIVAGVAVNLLAVGVTGVAYRSVFGVTGTALTIPGAQLLSIPWLCRLPLIGEALFAQTLIGYFAFLMVPACALLISGSVPGLVLRMVGENPYVAAAQGISVARVRMLAILACGALAGIGGAYLAAVYARTFVEGMSAGRGFIALAIVIFGRWSPWGILGAALVFGLASALQFHFQALGLPIPYQFSLLLPYVVTLAVLAIFSGKARVPAALGQPYSAD